MSNVFVFGNDEIVSRLAAKLFPGREVRDMTLRFPYGGVAEIDATFFMHEHDVLATIELANELKGRASRRQAPRKED